ncbi:MAG: hypothetical protein JWQ58_2643 [Reyranella sp.]|nr:hypothetical protein [Reyranella sp.]
MNIAFAILAVLGVIAAVVGVARFTEGGARQTRILLCLVAALVVGGLFVTARPEVQRLAFERSDDYAWSVANEAIVREYPALKEAIWSSPALEADLRADVLRIVREHHSKLQDPAMLEAVSKAAAAVYRTKVMPLATQGSDEAVAAWGEQMVPVLQAFKSVSDDACGDYAMTGLNRSSPNGRIDTALAARQSAVVAAYNSSNAANKPPSAEELGAAYEQARTLTQPPFDDADMSAFRELKSQPKARQCELMLRLFTAIARLPLKEKAAIYRTIMANS